MADDEYTTGDLRVGDTMRLGPHSTCENNMRDMAKPTPSAMATLREGELESLPRVRTSKLIYQDHTKDWHAVALRLAGALRRIRDWSDSDKVEQEYQIARNALAAEGM